MRRLIEEAFPLKQVSEDSKHEKSAGSKGGVTIDAIEVLATDGES